MPVPLRRDVLASDLTLTGAGAKNNGRISEMKDDCIVLIGMAGVGKSTIGTALAEALGFGFVDVDRYILEKDGQRIQEIIDSRGEAVLLRLEKERMYELGLSRTVLAPGGSIIYHPDLMDYLKKNATLVYLKDAFESIEARLSRGLNRGIVGLKSKTLRQVYDEREPLYARYADITVDCNGKSWGRVVAEIIEAYRSRHKGASPFAAA